MGDAIKPTGQALNDALSFDPGTDDENGAGKMIHDFPGNVAKDIGAKIAATERGAGDDEVVAASANFVENLGND
jgi:hypothetical protein